MKPDVWGGCLQGARARQEDSYDICLEVAGRSDSTLMVLCDGMGGHDGGAVASSIATKAFIAAFRAEILRQPPLAALRASLTKAHEAIKAEIADNDAPPDMGTTLVAVYLDASDVHWISVGDSHLYWWSDGVLTKLNADHSMAAVLDELVQIGRVSQDEALSDPNRSALRSSLSLDDLTLIDAATRTAFAAPGDKAMLASDGLNTLDASTLEKALSGTTGRNSQCTVARLLAEIDASRSDSQDNASIVVATFPRESYFSRVLRLVRE